MRKLAIRAMALVLMLSACGDNGTAETTTSAATTSSGSEASTTTTTEATTTTTQATTTPVPTRSVEVSVLVYDDWKTATTTAAAATTGDLRTNEPCTTNQIGVVSSDANVVLKDANTGDTLAIGVLGSGTLDNELIPPSVLPSDEPLFWMCRFEATLGDVPLDRDYYTLQVEGDDPQALTAPEGRVRPKGGRSRSDREPPEVEIELAGIAAVYSATPSV